jgi:putative ABC transport system permease protein
MNTLEKSFLRFTSDWRNPVGVAVVALILFIAFLYWEQTRFMLKSLRRNLLRSVLTGLATFILVLVITLVWSILAFLDRQTETKTKNLNAIVSERYQIPSQMPESYAGRLGNGNPHRPGDYEVNANRDSMVWAFYGGTLDPVNRARESIVFFFAMDPKKLIAVDAAGNYSTMMEDIDQISDEDKRRLVKACEIMEQDNTKVLIGTDRLKALNKKVGETIKVTSLNYKDIDLDFYILGELPAGRYEQSAVMNFNRLRGELDKYKRANGKAHAMDDKTVALMWLRLPDTTAFDKVTKQIMDPGQFTTPAVKCETASSAINNFLDAYSTILWFMRWPLGLAILTTMSLVISNAISISVRERRVEMAVLKVLGFTPLQILILVLGEALLIGCLSGILSGWLTLFIVNDLVGGIALPIAFFGKFHVAAAAPWWGLALGAGTALAGSFLPAWSARSVKVSEVFSKIA